MTHFPHHTDDTLCIPQRLSGDESKPEGRGVVSSISPFENIPCAQSKPKLVIIREEFVELTGDPLVAVVLNQLIYWSQRVTDFSLYVAEEKRPPTKRQSSLQYGWFRKENRELMEETMLRVTVITFRRYINCLVKEGWIQTRINPRYKWNRNPQYRVNLRKLCSDLQKKGYSFPGYAFYEDSEESIHSEFNLNASSPSPETENNSKERFL
jgi:hypothetical protein